MSEEEKTLTNEAGKEMSDGTEDYIAAINEMKQNSVPKERYQQVLDENRKLLKSIVNGESMQQEQKEPEIDVTALRHDLYSGKVELSNLEFWEKTLALRDYDIAQGKRDPFLAAKFEQADVEKAERVASVVKECIEECNGNSDIFTTLLQSRTVESMPIYKRR